MDTSKPHIAAAAGLGALLPFIPDLVKLIPALPSAVGNALCAVILAVAYAIIPKQAAPAKGGEAGYVRMVALQVLALAAAFAVVACAVLGSAKKDPGAVANTVYKDAQLACLACIAPPEAAKGACAKLKPVCDGLAGVCKDPAE